ncbi:GNAT family N-acetyltransferase [Gemmobacter serpentinus]|uniref:GNAT family N-acetyltransferase n=1 Tax=Gemmobacter serpentinus TaxID=2652247 RepID=UPI0018656F62|nr:GNAT family N-acetyltransferase [Gemmobacter serpentinus]
MSQITFAPCPVTAPEAQACMAAYFAELSTRFGEVFAPRPVDPDAGAMAPPRGQFLLARDAAGRIMGCVGLRSVAEGIGPGCGEIKRLWIAPEARGQGLARRLMATIEDTARAMGLTHLRLDTSRHLPEAQALYLRDGWQEIPAYNSNPHADHWFEKRLVPAG